MCYKVNVSQRYAPLVNHVYITKTSLGYPDSVRWQHF